MKRTNKMIIFVLLPSDRLIPFHIYTNQCNFILLSFVVVQIDRDISKLAPFMEILFHFKIVLSLHVANYGYVT